MDILESLSILHIILQISSFSQWWLNTKTWALKSSRLLVIYTTLTLIAAVSILLGFTIYNTNMNQLEINEIGHTVNLIQMLGIRFAHITSIVEALIRRKDQKKFYEQVRDIDRLFQNSLNIQIDNGKLRRRIMKCAICMIVIYFSKNILVIATKLSSSNRYKSIFWIMYLIPFILCGIRYFQIYTNIVIISVRLEKLIVILNEINLHQNITKEQPDINLDDDDISLTPDKLKANSLPVFKTISRYGRIETNLDLKRLLVIRDIYNRLWILSTLVNRCFGVSLLINVGNDFISITSNCYWIFLNYKLYSTTSTDIINVAASMLWSMPHFFNVLALALICERTVNSTTDVALGVHRIDIDIMNDNHNIVIEQFSLQLLHQKFAFTAAGFFKIDCTLLYTIAGATTTYLIILIQFHMSEQKSITTN